MANNKRSVIDLFSGVGGLSLGAARAGFQLTGAVELDSRALEFHKINFPKSFHLEQDVSLLAGGQLLDKFGLKMGELDGLIGGPPCQGFSDIGLRSTSDPRNELFKHFFRLVKEVKPAFFLAENVPGVVKERNKDVVEAALQEIPSEYKVLRPIVIRASDLGAPTIRTRVFFIGFDPEKINEFSEQDFTQFNAEDVRVSRALYGIPPIRSNWQTEDQSWRSVGSLPAGEFENRVMNAVPAGVGDQNALARLKQKALVSGFFGTTHKPETVARFRTLGPGESDSVSKCVRLDPNGYCPTLRAGTGPERGSYQAIRPVHPSSPRVISPREAARLQGFPDWFQFHPTKWHAFRQIGNSVSPIVSERLLRVIFSRF